MNKEQYEELSVKIGLSAKTSKTLFGFTLEQIRELYREDNYLNNIPLKWWDNWGYTLAMYSDRVMSLTLAERVCLLKHIVVRDVCAV